MRGRLTHQHAALHSYDTASLPEIFASPRGSRPVGRPRISHVGRKRYWAETQSLIIS